MIWRMYVLYDKISESYDTPWYARTDAEAMRNLKYHLDTPGTLDMLKSHPEDYDLYRLGIYNTETSGILIEDMPYLVCHVASLSVAVEEDDHG